MMNETTKICAIVLNYNDTASVRNCVRALLDCPSLDRIVLVDNHSTDKSAEELKKLSASSVKIDLLLSPANNGYAFGNNLGCHYAREHYQPRYLLILNPDVVIEEEAISSLIQTMDAHDDLALLTAQVKQMSDIKMSQGQAWKLRSLHMEIRSMFTIFTKLLGDLSAYKNRKFDEKINYVDVVSGSCLCYRADDFFEIGGFDERTFLFYEENIMARKLAARGKKTAILGHVSYLHYHSVSIKKSIQSLNEREKLINRSRDIYVYHYLQPRGWSRFAYQIAKKLSFFDRMILLLKRRIINGDR